MQAEAPDGRQCHAGRQCAKPVGLDIHSIVERPLPANICRSRTRRIAVARLASPSGQAAAGAGLGVTTFGGWVPSDLRRFLPLAVLRT